MAHESTRSWLLCIHNIPPKPGYLRAKIARRLAAMGAQALKNAVYVLPDSGQAREDMAWLTREIEEGGGKAFVCAADFVTGLTDGQVRAQFMAASDARYAELAVSARELLQGVEGTGDEVARQRIRADLAKLRRDFEAVRTLDFFGAAGRESVEGQLSAVEGWLAKAESDESRASLPASPKDFQDRIWVTRKGIHVDRMASAWFIRRFIDSQARFKFVEAGDYRPQEGEIRFDMLAAEFTHEGDLCTFEVLLKRLGPDDPNLRAVAQLVHDIDLKDERYGRPETPGIAALLASIAAREPDDLARIERGGQVLDDLFEFYNTGAQEKPEDML